MSSRIDKAIIMKELLEKSMSEPYDKKKDDYATGDGPPPHHGFGKHDDTQGEPWKAKIGRVERHTESSGA